MKRGQAPWVVPDLDACEVLTIKATTPAGFVADDPWWPLMFDGLLAMVDVQVRLGIRAGQVARVRPVLPLLMASPDNRRRVWIATCGMWPGRDTEPQPWGRRSDTSFARAHGVTGRINSSTGPDKARWSSDQVHVAGEVTWRAAGVADAVRDMLADVHQIGGRRGRGNGRVTRWSVESEPLPSTSPTDILRAVTVDSDGRLLRPMHHCFAEMVGRGPDAATTPGVFRPPYGAAASLALSGPEARVPVLVP